MRLRLPQRRIWRVAIYLVSFLLVLLAIDLIMVQARRRIHPGYSTTRIGGPVREDGRIDYLTAIESFFGAGVTPQNNAMPLLLQAFGRAALPQNQPEDGITSRLGMPHLPGKGNYYIRYEDWCRQRSVEPEPNPADPSRPVVIPIEVSQATEQWLEANENALAVVAEASRRERFFVPFNGGRRTLTLQEILLPHSTLLAEIHRPLLTRAMLRLQSSDVDGFMDDVLTVHRMARLVAEASTLVERMMAIQRLELPACRVVRAGVLSGKLSGTQAKALADKLSARGDLPPITDAINISERYIGLDTMQTLSVIGPRAAASLLDMAILPRQKLPPAVMWLVPFPYEQCMRAVNHFHDGALAAASLPTYPQRIAGLKSCEAELDRAQSRSEIAKRFSGDWPAAYLLPALIRAHEHAEAARMELRLTRIALALAAFRADRGAYPSTLSELQPQYFPSVPGDLFSDKPLIYSRTTTGYVLTSVGPNMIDDGQGTGSPGDDIVVRAP